MGLCHGRDFESVLGRRWRNIADDRRLAKPAIVKTIEMFVEAWLGWVAQRT